MDGFWHEMWLEDSKASGLNFLILVSWAADGGAVCPSYYLFSVDDDTDDNDNLVFVFF